MSEPGDSHSGDSARHRIFDLRRRAVAYWSSQHGNPTDEALSDEHLLSTETKLTRPDRLLGGTQRAGSRRVATQIPRQRANSHFGAAKAEAWWAVWRRRIDETLRRSCAELY